MKSVKKNLFVYLSISVWLAICLSIYLVSTLVSKIKFPVLSACLTLSKNRISETA